MLPGYWFTPVLALRLPHLTKQSQVQLRKRAAQPFACPACDLQENNSLILLAGFDEQLTAHVLKTEKSI